MFSKTDKFAMPLKINLVRDLRFQFKSVYDSVVKSQREHFLF